MARALLRVVPPMIRSFAVLSLLAGGSVLVSSHPAAAQPVLGVAAPGAAGPREERDLPGEAEIVANVNALRAEAGLSPLSRDSALDEAALVHTRDMLTTGQLVHVSPRTGNPADRVRAAGVSPERVGENIAQGADAAAAYASILGSELHRDQLLDPAFTHLGLAVLRGERSVYLTQVFARQAPVAPEQAAPLPPPSVQDVPAPPVPTPAPDPVPQVEAASPEVLPAADGPPLPPNAPLLRVPVLTRPVRGYWVWHANRWWYFDLPETAQAGELLRPNLNVTGPPPGYAAVPPAPGQRIQVWPRHAAPRPLWRTPRRRVYWY